jgi:hypothetical protein
MQQLDLDTADPAVKQFFLSLPSDPEGVELVLRGDVVCRIVGPTQLTEIQKQALFARGRELVRRARERNRGVAADVLEREVGQAVDEVRRRKRQ